MNGAMNGAMLSSKNNPRPVPLEQPCLSGTSGLPAPCVHLLPVSSPAPGTVVSLLLPGSSHYA